MKKIIFTFALIAFSFKIFALTIYAPTLVLPADGAINQMPNALLDWSAVSGAFSYKIQVDTSASFTNPYVYTATLTATNASELLFGIRHYWRVKAIGAGDSSVWSSVRSFTVLSYFNLVSPHDSTLHCSPDTLLKWATTVKGCTYFDYEADTSANFNSLLLYSNSVNGTLHQANPGNLHFGMKYYWRVRGRHSKDTTEWSQDTTAFANYRCFFTIDILNLYTPSDSAINQTPDVQMKWRKVTGLTKYEYQTDSTNLFNSPKLFIGYINNPLTPLAKADTLDFGTLYYWRVRAIHSTDTSEWSLIKQYTVLDTVTLSSPAIGQTVYTTTPLLKWTLITGITGYELEIDTVSGFTNPAKYTPGSSAIQQQVNALNMGKTYFWRMRAISSRDTSSWCNTWSFNVSGSGIDSHTLNSSRISIFPNPAYENVYVKIESDDITKINVAIVDILGKQIREEVYDVAPGSSLRKLNLEGITNGIYMLKFTDGNSSCIQKLTISR
ncbi:MAG: T9SS type A sorting domain-containing protein [Bacteroidales bacterium]